ncbi:MAG: Uncharacterised protein [Hyphomonas sp. TMED17]|nr:MAG: Uncharacterised protein [Hyphomonas sp. TMED17]
MREFGRITNRRASDRLSTNFDRVAIDADIYGQRAVDTVIFEKMRIGFDRAEIINCNDLYIRASIFQNGPQD